MNSQAAKTDHRIANLSTQQLGQEDDLFITCNSFEKRCLGIPRSFEHDFRTRFSIVFRFEPNVGEAPSFENDRCRNFEELTAKLRLHTSRDVIPIYCDRKQVDDGIGQFKSLFGEYLQKYGHSRITVDITCFTKLYLLELLHFLVEEMNLKGLRVVYNRAKAYGNANLTFGIKDILYMPHFPGGFFPNRETVLIVFVGFETERALGIWDSYEPFRTIVVLANPPLRPTYYERARVENRFILSRPAVITTTMDPYDPFQVSRDLEAIYRDKCTDRGLPTYNVGVISLGTKIQSLGLFLFWRRHKNVRITYAFPRGYGPGYAQRTIGENFLFNLTFPSENSDIAQ